MRYYLFAVIAFHSILSVSGQSRFASVQGKIIEGNSKQAQTELQTLLAIEGDSSLRDSAIELLGTLYWGDKNWKKLDSLLKLSAEADSSGMPEFVHALALAERDTLVFHSAKSSLRMKQRYSSGNPQIVAEINKKKAKGIVDTGAGISLVSASFARKYGVVLLDSQYSAAQSGSGKSIPMQAGLIESLFLGDIEFQHVVVGIVPDESMEFKFAGIKIIDIDLIIGWNILQEVGLEYDLKEGKLILHDPMQMEDLAPNLFWYSIPSMRASLNGSQDIHCFEIDLGGDECNLYPPFLKQYSDSLVTFKEDEFGSAGGFISYKAFQYPRMCLTIHGHEQCIGKVRSRPSLPAFSLLQPMGVIGLSIAEGKRLIINPKKQYLTVK